MKREEIMRTDFPGAPDGYDRATVDAHLEAVAATVSSMELRLKAAEVELGVWRRHDAAGPAGPEGPSHRGDANEREAGGSAPPEERSDDEQAARIVVMKMALDGVDRAEIVDHVAARYRLEDPAGLVDEISSRASPG